MQDIVEKIIKKSNEQKLELAEALKNPTLMTFTINNTNSGLEEKIHYYDPLYSNKYVRNTTNNFITIQVKVEANEEMSRFDRGIIIKKSGYGRFVYDGSESSEWRECKIKEKEKESAYSVKFKSFENPCKNLLIILDTFRYGEKDVVIDEI